MGKMLNLTATQVAAVMRDLFRDATEVLGIDQQARNRFFNGRQTVDHLFSNSAMAAKAHQQVAKTTLLHQTSSNGLVSLNGRDDTIATVLVAITQFESFRAFAYFDGDGKTVTKDRKRGYLSIGLGVNLVAQPIPLGIGIDWSWMILDDLVGDLTKTLPLFVHLSTVQQIGLLHMAYWMGVSNVLEFKHMLTALKEERDADVVAELFDSEIGRKAEKHKRTEERLHHIAACLVEDYSSSAAIMADVSPKFLKTIKQTTGKSGLPQLTRLLNASSRDHTC